MHTRFWIYPDTQSMFAAPIPMPWSTTPSTQIMILDAQIELWLLKSLKTVWKKHFLERFNVAQSSQGCSWCHACTQKSTRSAKTASLPPFVFCHTTWDSRLMLTTRQVSLLFEKQDRDTMSVYADKIRTSLSKHLVSPHWVRTREADEKDDIVRNNIDESYEIPNDFYSRWCWDDIWDSISLRTMKTVQNSWQYSKRDGHSNGFKSTKVLRPWSKFIKQSGTGEHKNNNFYRVGSEDTWISGVKPRSRRNRRGYVV